MVPESTHEVEEGFKAESKGFHVIIELLSDLEVNCTKNQIRLKSSNVKGRLQHLLCVMAFCLFHV